MAARRCSLCGINYPNVYNGFAKCHVCEETLDMVSNADPDEDWQGMVRRRLEVARLAEEIAAVIPGPADPAKPLPIYEEGGVFFINDGDLRRAGIIPPAADRRMWLFRANGHIWETQGWHESKRRWWVEEVCTEDPP